MIIIQLLTCRGNLRVHDSRSRSLLSHLLILTIYIQDSVFYDGFPVVESQKFKMKKIGSLNTKGVQIHEIIGN